MKSFNQVEMDIKHYYAVLSKYDEGVVAEFPDIDDFQAIGSDFADAYRAASKDIISFFAQEKVTMIRKPTSFEDLKLKHSGLNKVILPIPI
ncbi:MAG: hypothetical protein MJE63_13160 [Proteobacteria bacterium]|nr:hypothetical protein [Pseudomonadota bacterium]